MITHRKVWLDQENFKTGSGKFRLVVNKAQIKRLRKYRSPPDAVSPDPQGVA